MPDNNHAAASGADTIEKPDTEASPPAAGLEVDTSSEAVEAVDDEAAFICGKSLVGVSRF